MKYNLLIVFVLIALIPTTFSLNCYFCNSNENEDCISDNLPEIYKQECDVQFQPFCRKIIQTVNDQKSVVRTCGSTIGTKACYKTPGLNNVNVCSCNHDYCNHAVSLNRQQQVMTIISSFILLAITMFMFR